ncbi:hypothetical protein MKY96_32885 [Paenibacillus sp. FSL R7-0302]|uniref:hypothetical protein n=1 Tax=Paenibacillus sp. FSL R7-0302 TaxID=2921681 RepID=UPI0030F8A0F3
MVNDHNWGIREVLDIKFFDLRFKTPHNIVSMKDAVTAYEEGSVAGVLVDIGGRVDFLQLGKDVLPGFNPLKLVYQWVVLT